MDQPYIPLFLFSLLAASFLLFSFLPVDIQLDDVDLVDEESEEAL